MLTRRSRHRCCRCHALALLLPFTLNLGDAVFFEFLYFDNDRGDFASRGWMNENSLLQQNIQAAGVFWGAEFDSQETVIVHVEADEDALRSGGTNALGRQVGVDIDGNQVYEPAARMVMLSGSSGTVMADMFLSINAAFLDEYYWLDPTPFDRFDERVPFGLTDFVSIVLHELGHGLGMAGYRSFDDTNDNGYGTLPGFATIFDALSFFDSHDGDSLDAFQVRNPLNFHGPFSTALHCGPVPLSHFEDGHLSESQNFYHIGASCDASLTLVKSLMNGCGVPTDGSRLHVTDMDRAIVADMGYPLIMNPLETRTIREECKARPPPGGICPRFANQMCNLASKSKLTVSVLGNGERSFKFRYRGGKEKGDLKSASMFGLPTAVTDYAMCFYQDSALLYEMSISSGNNWEDTSSSRQGRYSYKSDTTDVVRVNMKAGASSSNPKVVKIGVDGQSFEILPNAPVPPGPFDDFSVHLVNNVPFSEACFGASFRTVRKSDSVRFVVACNGDC